MIQIIRKVDKSNFIPVDQWDTEEHPIDPKDRIFKSIHGEIILPIAEFYCNGDDDKKSINYFSMNRKRSYNSEEVRTHICRYLNYFEKFYDVDKELLMCLYKLKIAIDYNADYPLQMLVSDINRYIIRNDNIAFKIRHFVDDNYNMKLSSNNNKTPNLQFNNAHAKILYEISMLMNIYIPVASHYMYIHGIHKSEDIKKIMFMLYDAACIKYKEERGIDIYNKIYETAVSVVNKSKNPDKPLWEKNMIRGYDPTIHTKESVHDIILQIMPKYNYEKNIVNFNYFSSRQTLRFKVTDISYEYSFVKLSSSKRDSDQNSEMDRYEANINKKDEALAIQNKVSAEQTVKIIENAYGPFYDDEIEHYRKKLSRDGSAIINDLQLRLVSLLFVKDFGDPQTINAIPNHTEYIKMIIAAKRLLYSRGLKILPYIISSKVVRIASRKIISKKDTIRIENSKLYNQVKEKYKSPKVEQYVMEFIGEIVSSSFEIIDYDTVNHCPGEYDGEMVPMLNDIINEELMFFISII